MWLNTLAWHVWGLRGLSHQHLWLRSAVSWGLSHSLLLWPLLWLFSKLSHVSSLLQQQCSAPFQTLSHSLIPPNGLMLTLFLANGFSLSLKCLASAMFTCKPHKLTSLTHYPWKSQSFLSIQLVEPGPRKGKVSPRDIFGNINFLKGILRATKASMDPSSTDRNMQN